MFSSSVITLRETLETSLIVGIVLAYLSRTANLQHKRSVWLGVGAAVAVSIIAGIIVSLTIHELEGRAEELYEGVTMLLAAAMLTWMILWMLKHGRLMRQHIEKKVERSHTTEHAALGIFFLVFINTLREGLETVLFLQAAFLQARSNWNFVGAGAGIIVAIFLAVSLFKGALKISPKIFFLITNVALILFATSLVAEGLHELEEAGMGLPVHQYIPAVVYLLSIGVFTTRQYLSPKR